MNTPPNNTSDNQEIDLSQISRRVKKISQKLNDSFFDLLIYLQKNLLLIIIIIGLGFAIGFFLEGNKKHYESKIIVTPNYGSTEYLYTQIDFINSNINNKNEKFLKSIGLTTAVENLKVKPIVDIYRLVNDSDKNYELLKLMAEEGDLSKILLDDATSKNYKQHEIVITSNETINKRDLKLFLEFMNANEYFLNLQKEVLSNVKSKMKNNAIMLQQIDKILDNYPKQKASTNLMFNNESISLEEIIKFKDELLLEQGNRKIELLNYNSIIKDNSSVINIIKKQSIFGKLSLIFPILFIFFLIAIKIFINYYKNQKLKRLLV